MSPPAGGQRPLLGAAALCAVFPAPSHSRREQQRSAVSLPDFVLWGHPSPLEHLKKISIINVCTVNADESWLRMVLLLLYINKEKLKAFALTWMNLKKKNETKTASKKKKRLSAHWNVQALCLHQVDRIFGTLHIWSIQYRVINVSKQAEPTYRGILIIYRIHYKRLFHMTSKSFTFGSGWNWLAFNQQTISLSLNTRG